MSRRRRLRGAAKRDGRGFTAWPHECGTSASFYALSLAARALLLELLTQYRGNNNGDLCVAWGLIKERGWRSRATVEKARDELEATGWIVQTRQGGKHKSNLYALTLFDVDECDGKLDAGAPIGQRLSYWKTGANPLAKRTSKKN